MRLLSQLNKRQLKGKQVLLRVNLDVEPSPKSWRLNRVVPTIKFLLNNGANITIFGHRGRPKIKNNKLSVKPAINILSDKVNQKLNWLENIRFDSRERAEGLSLAEELAGKAEIFVNDDFASSHHASATASLLPKIIPSYAGLLVEEEISALSKVKDKAKKPLVIIIGGIKIEDKTGVIDNFYKKANRFLMGSAYNKIPNNKSQITNKLQNANSNLKKIVFPLDYSSKNKLDIGPKTVEKYKEIINSAKTIIWNGPLGKFEDERYRGGSVEIAKTISDSSAFSVIGGGDTLELIEKAGFNESDFGFVSTGGGAMLAFLAGEKMPAIKVLR